MLYSLYRYIYRTLIRHRIIKGKDNPHITTIADMGAVLLVYNSVVSYLFNDGIVRKRGGVSPYLKTDLVDYGVGNDLYEDVIMHYNPRTRYASAMIVVCARLGVPRDKTMILVERAALLDKHLTNPLHVVGAVDFIRYMKFSSVKLTDLSIVMFD